jgi:hypothetical protein
MWFDLAAVNQEADAVKNRDEIATKLTPSQLALAQRLSKRCLDRKFKKCY